MNQNKLTPEEWQLFEDYLLGLDQTGIDEINQQMKDIAYETYPDLKQFEISQTVVGGRKGS